MTFTKILIDKDIQENNLIEIKGDNFFYLTGVLRHKKNDLFFLIAKNYYYLMKIISIERDRVIAEIQEKRKIKDVSLRINLFFGILKGDKNDFVIKAGTQYSVSSFHPLIMKRTVVKLNADDRLKKRDRFQRVAEDMARESFLGFVPIVHDITELNRKDFPEGLKILFYEGENTRKLVNIKNDIKKSENLSLFFGPEGGIDKDEYEYLRNKGFIPVSLGERMLKAEFAVIAGITMVSFIKEGKIL
ncbi:MAG: 16S rRNA (uracil(1498)-N(3))-methyltransferase [Proteobacteria bacterium]|nr:16S rRNA (uracil(1498)-N(3))-methyltransferase [Pseudomonadota bacterium]